MPLTPAQQKRFVSVTSPFGENVLLFKRMNGYEEMARLFEYDVELLSTHKQLDAKKILGQGMTIAIDLPVGGKRHYHGLVTRFQHLGVDGEFFVYRAVLKPWLWFLTRTTNCRVFQEKTVPDIIKAVFEKNGFSDLKFDLTGTYSPRNYCVQYRESDFNFVSRLMEFEGIYYFFKHEDGKHTLIIADSISAYQTITDYEKIPYFPPENEGNRDRDHIFEWHHYHDVQPGGYVLTDFDFEKPKSSLLSQFKAEKSHSHGNGEYFDYPGGYLDTGKGDKYANIRLDEFQTNYELIRGRGNAVGLTSGMLFELQYHYIADENMKYVLVSNEFVIVSDQYRSSGAGYDDLHYECSFAALRSDQQFRPQRLTPVPFVQGAQTAIVVGKSGEEIWTDKHGRVKVQFHWDREGKNDENSSCWVRVSFPMAGKNWGWVSLPRIGQEVIVSFLEGDPDQPIITGRVYNGEQIPPYDLPANQTQSGIKTRSSKGGTGENFNELRFEDKKDEEEIYLHAEKDFNGVIENNETRKIGLDKKDPGDQTVEIHNNRTVTLNEGNDKLQVKKGNRTTLIDKGNDELTVSMGNLSIKVEKGKITLEAMQAIEFIVGKSKVTIDQKGIATSSLTMDVKANTKLDVGSPMTTVKGDGMLTLQGALTKIN